MQPRPCIATISPFASRALFRDDPALAALAELLEGETVRMPCLDGDHFEGTPAVSVTKGNFFVQGDRNHIYGVFSVTGPAFEVKDGRFRFQLPRALCGH